MSLYIGMFCHLAAVRETTTQECDRTDIRKIESVQLKSGPYFNMSNLFTKIYNMLYYTTNLYLQ